MRGFPMYEISNMGRVKSHYVQRILKPGTHRAGHKHVQLSLNGFSHKRYVHRLVAEAFIPNPEGKPDVAHNNGVPWDNRVENLRWATELENSRDRERHGTLFLSITPEMVKEIDRLCAVGDMSQRAIAKAVGVSQASVSRLYNRTRSEMLT